MHIALDFINLHNRTVASHPLDEPLSVDVQVLEEAVLDPPPVELILECARWL